MKNKWDTPTLDSNGKQLKMYTQWAAMMLRSRFQPYAENVVIDDRFKSYDFFIDWAKSQKGWMHTEESGRVWSLDKDIVGDGSIYSPDVCVFVPAVINNLNIKSLDHSLPRCVSKTPSGNYIGRIKVFGKRKSLGTYGTIQEATESVISAKLKYIDTLDEVYSKLLDERVIPNLRKNTMEIFLQYVGEA